MRVITLLSFSGGVGRTSMAINVSRAMPELADAAVRVLDLDPNRALMRASGLDHPWYISGPACWRPDRSTAVCTLKGLDDSANRFRASRVRRAFLDVASGHHITIVDTPPGLSSLTNVVLSLTDIALLLVNPDGDVAAQIERLDRHLARFSNPPLIRAVGVRGRAIHGQSQEFTVPGAYTYTRRMYPMMIPESSDLPASFRAGVSISDYAPGSRVAAHYDCLAALLGLEVKRAKVELFLRTLQKN